MSDEETPEERKIPDSPVHGVLDTTSFVPALGSDDIPSLDQAALDQLLKPVDEDTNSRLNREARSRYEAVRDGSLALPLSELEDLRANVNEWRLSVEAGTEATAPLPSAKVERAAQALNEALTRNGWGSVPRRTPAQRRIRKR